MCALRTSPPPFFTPRAKVRDLGRLAIYYYVPKSSLKYKFWSDGFTAAMEKMSESWDIDWIYAGKGIPIKFMRSYDAIFVKSNWGWRVDRKFRKWSAFFRSPSFLVLSGSLPPPREVKALPYDHVFFETSWYKQWEKDLPSSSRAFGVNTDIYYPGVRKKEWDYLGVGALREYKRWDRLAQRPGRKLVIGEVRGPDATALKHKLQKSGVTVLDFQPPHKLREYILAAQTVYIPAELQGGESAPCGKLVHVVFLWKSNRIMQN